MITLIMLFRLRRRVRHLERLLEVREREMLTMGADQAELECEVFDLRERVKRMDTAPEVTA